MALGRGGGGWGWVVGGGLCDPVLGDSEHDDVVIVTGERGGEDAGDEGHGGGEEVGEGRREEGYEVRLPLIRPQQPWHRHACPKTPQASRKVPL